MTDQTVGNKEPQQPRGCPETVWDGPYSFVCNAGASPGVCATHGRFRDDPTSAPKEQ